MGEHSIIFRDKVVLIQLSVMGMQLRKPVLGKCVVLNLEGYCLGILEGAYF